MSPSPPPTDDRAEDERRLVTGLLANDPGVVREFLERTHHPVWCLACRVTRDFDERRDFAHDALLGVLEDMASGRFEYRHPGGFWSWFRRRAYFRLLDSRRRARLRQGREHTPTADEPALEEYGVTDTFTKELERVELAAAVEDCLERVPNEMHRRALRLLLAQEWQYQQIADALAAPLNSVRVWILRGRAAMRRCLATRWGLWPGGTGDRA